MHELNLLISTLDVQCSVTNGFSLLHSLLLSPLQAQVAVADVMGNADLEMIGRNTHPYSSSLLCTCIHWVIFCRCRCDGNVDTIGLMSATV